MLVNEYDVNQTIREPLVLFSYFNFLEIIILVFFILRGKKVHAHALELRPLQKQADDCLSPTLN